MRHLQQSRENARDVIWAKQKAASINCEVRIDQDSFCGLYTNHVLHGEPDDLGM
jgi:hypothetical protein